MAGKKRITNHSGSGDINHNFRTYDEENVKDRNHIDSSLTQNNKMWFYSEYQEIGEYYAENKTDMRFYESQVYDEWFSAGLELQNNKNLKKGNKDRVKTMEEKMYSKGWEPMETLHEIGNVYNPVNADDYAKIYEEYRQWHDEKFGSNIRLLDAVLHVDEPNSGPHIHERQVMFYHDEAGNLVPGVDKALKELGLDLPDPTKDKSRYNSRKMTYTKMCREEMVEIAKKHGLDIEDKPKPKEDTGKSLEQLKADTVKAEWMANKAFDLITDMLDASEEVGTENALKIQDMQDEMEIQQYILDMQSNKLLKVKKAYKDIHAAYSTLKDSKADLEQKNKELTDENDRLSKACRKAAELYITLEALEKTVKTLEEKQTIKQTTQEIKRDFGTLDAFNDALRDIQSGTEKVSDSFDFV